MAVAAEVEGQQRAFFLGIAGTQHHRSGAVAEQCAGRAIGGVEGMAESVHPDQQSAVRQPGADQRADAGQAVDEAGAGGGQVERERADQPQARRDPGRGGRAAEVAGAGCQHHRIDSLQPRRGERGGGRPQGQVAAAEVAGDMPLAHAGAAADPGVGSVQLGGEHVVAEHGLGQVAAQAADHGGARHGSGSLDDLGGGLDPAQGLEVPQRIPEVAVEQDLSVAGA